MRSLFSRCIRSKSMKVCDHSLASPVEAAGSGPPRRRRTDRTELATLRLSSFGLPGSPGARHAEPAPILPLS